MIASSAESIILDTHPQDRNLVLKDYNLVCEETDRLTAPLSPEDQAVQSTPDASPIKWHRAHVTWVFETMTLMPCLRNCVPLDPLNTCLFNSYYDSIGAWHSRPDRGLLTRSSADQVTTYRAHVDAGMRRLIADAGYTVWAEAAPMIALGLYHEQQH